MKSEKNESKRSAPEKIITHVPRFHFLLNQFTSPLKLHLKGHWLLFCGLALAAENAGSSVRKFPN